MYNTKLIEVLDGFCISSLIPLAVFTLLLNVVAMVAVIRLRADHHIAVLGNMIFCDILIVVCQSFSLKALIQGRAVTMETDILCNVCGVIFTTCISVTWWCLTLAFLIKMWHVPMTRGRYHLAIVTIWTVAIFIAVTPYLGNKVYHMSWTHAMCLLDDLWLIHLPKLSLPYSVLFSAVLFLQYLLPVCICVAGIVKDLCYVRGRIRGGWSCTVMVFLTYCLFHVLWWVDLCERHYTQTTYPVYTSTIIRRTATLMLLYTKPLASLFCMYNFMSEFRSMYLRIIGLKHQSKMEDQYERMYSEDGEEEGQLTTSH